MQYVCINLIRNTNVAINIVKLKIDWLIEK